MPFDALPGLFALALTAASWSRLQIEVAVEFLLKLLDAEDADADLEPQPEAEDRDGLAADEGDAKDAAPVQRVQVARQVRASGRSASVLVTTFVW